DLIGNVERDEEAHVRIPQPLALRPGGPGGLAVASINEVAPQQIERGLGSVPTDALAVAGKAQDAVAHAVGVGQGDINEADGLFRRASGWSGDSGDADAQRRADAAAN